MFFLSSSTVCFNLLLWVLYRVRPWMFICYQSIDIWHIGNIIPSSSLKALCLVSCMCYHNHAARQLIYSPHCISVYCASCTQFSAILRLSNLPSLLINESPWLIGWLQCPSINVLSPKHPIRLQTPYPLFGHASCPKLCSIGTFQQQWLVRNQLRV